MLEARELLCERDERTLFSGLSFTLNAGEWVQITGSNGAGKTTLLRLLTGLSRPDAGEVLWQGQPLHQVRDSYHQNLLWIGHQPGIKTRLTALENLHFYHRGWRYRTMSGSPGAGRACRIRRYSCKSALGRATTPRRFSASVADPCHVMDPRRAFYRD
ncbi:heme exporter ATP-binding protein (cytochrome C-type biogenesis protein) [Escherichia coli]|uniref:Heme exporter ATP-binding protein (Cytochrome C-type biogenesis protein) n=1 Tax=Escherichia coli TaxID=562 RepID=A0A2X3K4L3_ECOLX|nr:heme exporter ATP-binding protein (cytochrome C-type biogenesis protein) [Escherichia coli]